MRIFFNHGLTASELYTNTSKKVIDRKWTWFISKYGHTSSYEDAIADPFKYCFGLVLHKIIEERVRFKIPFSVNGYIDFEIVLGDSFVKQRQNGRFQEIDFINSDFTGYALKYYFDAKAYQREYPIYIGGDLKKKFLNGINSGVKYNTVKDITINDFIDPVHEKFKELTKEEIKRLLVLGFRRLHSAMRYGCAITINTTKFINCYAYIGELSLNPEKQIKQYSSRKDKKLRKIAMWKKIEFDGYYYIGLNPSAFKEWVELNKNSRSLIKFPNVMIRKIQEELYYRHKHMFIFKVPVKKYKGWLFWAESPVFRKVEYLGESLDFNFTASSKSWKELIKEYEATSN